MKSVVKIFVMTMFSFGLIYSEQANAQALEDNNTATSIALQRIELSDNKTTNIIFPHAIKSVDRGSADVIAQVVQGFGNVLQLKASTPNFKQTNVTIITSDGKFYSFLADYNNDPKGLNISFVQHGTNNENALALPDEENAVTLDNAVSDVLKAKSFLHKHINNEQMKLCLSGIYLKDNLMWFKLNIGNHSQVGFGIDILSFSVVDKKQVKRTARQELQLQPVYTTQIKSIKGKITKEIVLAFKPFTLSNTKRLKIQVSDKTGGRNLMLLIKAKKLLRARLIK